MTTWTEVTWEVRRGGKVLQTGLHGYNVHVSDVLDTVMRSHFKKLQAVTSVTDGNTGNIRLQMPYNEFVEYTVVITSRLQKTNDKK